MIHITTGANGTGKTLFTLFDVMARAVKEGRPVVHNGRFEVVEGGPLDAWKQIDFKDWQAEPDGTIVLVDECHNEMPTRGTGAPPPHIQALAEHRRRGFDFYLITQHPSNIDSFVRRLIGNPGWHRHLKRQAGAALVSQLEWDAVNIQCERPGSSKSGSGTATMRAFPKEVYGWYRSAQLHTAKFKMPRAVWILAASVLVLAGGAAYVYRDFAHRVQGGSKAGPQAAPAGVAAGAPAARQGKEPPMTPAEYAQAYAPRIKGIPYTAPAFDKVTEPTRAPLPAACISSRRVCKCYTQDATPYDTTDDICRQMADHGVFLPFNPDAHNLHAMTALPQTPGMPQQGPQSARQGLQPVKMVSIPAGPILTAPAPRPFEPERIGGRFLRPDPSEGLPPDPAELEMLQSTRRPGDAGVAYPGSVTGFAVR